MTSVLRTGGLCQKISTYFPDVLCGLNKRQMYICVNGISVLNRLLGFSIGLCLPVIYDKNATTYGAMVFDTVRPKVGSRELFPYHHRHATNQRLISAKCTGQMIQWYASVENIVSRQLRCLLKAASHRYVSAVLDNSCFWHSCGARCESVVKTICAAFNHRHAKQKEKLVIQSSKLAAVNRSYQPNLYLLIADVSASMV